MDVVRPLPGPGLAARAGDLLLVCADGAPRGAELLDLVAEVAAAGGDGSVLVRRVAALLASDFEASFPACAVCGPVPDGRLAVLVHGAAAAEVAGGDGAISLTGADAVTSVNRLVGGPIGGIRLRLPGAGAAGPLVRLDGGVVPAAGLVQGDPPPAPDISTIDAEPAASFAPSPPPPESWVEFPRMVEPLAMDPPPAPYEPPVFEVPPFVAPPPSFVPQPPASEPAAVQAQRFEVPALETPPFETPPFEAPHGDGPAGAPPMRQPDPAAPFVAVVLVGQDDAPDEPPAPAPDPRPRVLGVLCANDHFNDPSALLCAVCGTALSNPARHEAPRPPLGVLRLDDGSTYRLDSDYVVGREPHQDPEVAGGTVRPLRLIDTDGIVSRRHLRIILVGWDVQVMDLGSANGTTVHYPDEAEHVLLQANRPVVLRPGTQVSMGRRWLRFESRQAP